MKRSLYHLLAILIVIFLPYAALSSDDDGWIPLFDGKTLDGWKASEKGESTWVEDGKIVVNGVRSHLFYVGDVQDHNFKNFEFKAEVMAFPNSNSGIYFHTEYQQDGWPSKGYECQVNNSQEHEPRKTGSLYAVKDVNEPPVKDEEWFSYHIIVKGKHIVIKINDKVTVDYTEEENPSRRGDHRGKLVSSGTFALQAHDPGSKVYFRNIMVKPLPSE